MNAAIVFLVLIILVLIGVALYIYMMYVPSRTSKEFKAELNKMAQAAEPSIKVTLDDIGAKLIPLGIKDRFSDVEVYTYLGFIAANLGMTSKYKPAYATVRALKQEDKSYNVAEIRNSLGIATSSIVLPKGATEDNVYSQSEFNAMYNILYQIRQMLQTSEAK